MMRLFIAILCFFWGALVQAFGSSEKQKNICEKAVNKETGYRVTGVYGSSQESEQHTTVAYVLLREMKRFKVLRREFQKKTDEWRFDFLEMIGGKIIVFVYHLVIQTEFCKGPNSFFVVKQ